MAGRDEGGVYGSLSHWTIDIPPSSVYRFFVTQLQLHMDVGVVMATKRPKVLNLLDLIRRHLEQGTFWILKHAQGRKGQRNITDPEIRHVLLSGWHERKKDEFKEEYGAWNYAIRGKTVDNRELRIAVSFDEEGMLIITAIDLSGEG